ncbi:MAG TPA: hypothetical protein VI072_35235 [Polyangiaceae bacterium]
MESIDVRRLQQRARLKYEWSRAKRALIGFAPVLVLVALAAWIGQRPSTAALFGAILFATGVTLLWYGRDLRRAVLPGIVAGIVPLAFALCANEIGHACTGSGCMSLCIPACTLGGLAAGLGVALVAGRARRGAGFWIGASALALSTGAMGCVCMGYAGIAGLTVGYAAAVFPFAARRLFTGR